MKFILLFYGECLLSSGEFKRLIKPNYNTTDNEDDYLLFKGGWFIYQEFFGKSNSERFITSDMKESFGRELWHHILIFFTQRLK